MKRIKGFSDYVNESYLNGARAPLYHTTGIFFAPQILEEDTLKASPTWKVVSFSRNKDFIYEDKPVTFEIDQDKLSQNYKIVPFDYSYKIDHEASRKFQRESPDFESEEMVHGDIKDIHKYILSIRLNDNINRYKNYKYGTKEEYREAYDDLIVALLDYTAKYNVKVTDQKGNEITRENLMKMEELTEGIYNKDSGTRLFYSKASDEDTYKVYYSSYKPVIGKDPDDFMKFLKRKGITHHKVGKNSVTMNKSNVDKLKKSMLNLSERLVMDVEPEVEKEIEKSFHVDDPLIKAINIVAKHAHEMATKGETRTDTMNDEKGQLKAAVILRNAYFPGQAQFVSNAHFDLLAKRNKVYYRGVQEKKFIDDLHYNITNFMGHSNEYQGTWMTDDIKYARQYHFDEHPLEIIIKPDAKIGTDKEIDKIRIEYMRDMMKLQDYADSFEIEAKYKEIHYQTEYLKNYFMRPAIIAIALKYDGVRFTLDESDVVIMFNREKMVIRNPEQ